MSLEESKPVSTATQLPNPINYSDLSLPNRKVYVITTAALPWRTGTSVNPMLRALYLTTHLHPSSLVTLVIPWLMKKKHRITLFGNDSAFETYKEQEEYIYKYIKERCLSSTVTIESINKLKLLFYPARYVKWFGSIFPIVDLCSMFDVHDADVAILEEPEHLNWFRIPPSSTLYMKKKVASMLNLQDLENDEEDEDEEDETFGEENIQTTSNEEKELGWTHKFNYVAGIVHTNYEEYVKTSLPLRGLLGPAAIRGLSNLVIRAYCHKVIKLSATLPTFAPGKELVCNVHGVREEFIQAAETPITTHETNLTTQVYLQNEASVADVYFIGKLVWAKGFDIMIHVSDKYKELTGDYFPIDIYGNGPDNIAIQRAFHGRLQKNNDKEKHTNTHDKNDPPLTTYQAIGVSRYLCGASEIFCSPLNIRQQSDTMIVQDSYFPDTNSITADTTSTSTTEEQTHPISILSDFGEQTAQTGKAASKAVYHIADTTIQNGFSMTFSESSNEKYYFDPPKSFYELRSHPIPSRFHGSKDHIECKTLPHKIFFNPSISEVLCTTTAEALAMGKFVVLPKHPSNEFFYDFPNCLTYETLDECLEKLDYALKNQPICHSPDMAHKFTWDAASERLVESCFIKDWNVLETMKHTDDRIAWYHLQSGKRGYGLTQLLRGARNRANAVLSKEDYHTYSK